MTLWQVLYVAMAIVCYPVITAMLFRRTQAIHDSDSSRQTESRFEFGVCMVFAAFMSLIWPIGAVMAYLLTGFAEHGILRQK